MTGAKALKKVAKRRVQFYSVFVLSKGARRGLDHPPNWVEIIDAASKATVEELTIDGVICAPEVDADGRPTIGMFKELSTDFMSKIDPKTKKISDIDLNEADNFAHSTAVVFLPGTSVFGLVGSSGTLSPQHTLVREFLTHFLPLGPGQHWEVEPLMDPARLAEFDKADGVTEFEARFRSAPDLLSQQPQPGQILDYGDRIAQALGSEVEVKISVKINKAAGKEPRQGLKSIVSQVLPRVKNDPSSGARVRATNGMMNDELNLVAQKFSVEDEIPDVPSGNATFTLLMQLAKDVTADCETRVKELEKG